MKISYNWLKSYIPEIPPAEKLADIFTYHLTEVEGVEKLPTGDTIFDLNILPNRAHDLLSHAGVARELAGQLNLSFNDSVKTYTESMSKKNIQPTKLSIQIHSDGCRRYSARIVRNIKIAPSPEWIVKHLQSIGQRSINTIVDATNLVMFNCGQPCHAFDLSKLASEKIVITNAKDDEELPIVGREKIVAKLKSSDIVITDGEKTLALAGIKGGLDSGITVTSVDDFSGIRISSPDLEKSSTDARVDILLEVANFDPASIRKTARRLGLLSDAAKRFENDLSPELCDFGMLELSALIAEMCPDAIFEEIVDVYPQQHAERKIVFTTQKVSQKIGSKISPEEIEKILIAYSFIFSRTGDVFEVSVPALRLDLHIPEDMVEEIGRIYGYDNVIPVKPSINFVPKENLLYANITKARQMLLGAGYREVMTYSFTNKGDVEVLESASDKNFLRNNLSDGMRESFDLNIKNAVLFGVSDVKIFEIGTVFSKGKEEIRVAYATKKKIIELSLEDFVLSSENEFSQSEIIMDENDTSMNAHFKMWSVYPFITRDIAVWVPEGTVASVLSDMYREFGTQLLVIPPILFDSFTKDGKTSYGFRLVFQSHDRTLTDDEIHSIMANITDKLLLAGYTVR